MTEVATPKISASEIWKSRASEMRQSLKADMAKAKVNIKTYTKAFNILMREGFLKPADFSSYSASQCELSINIFERDPETRRIKFTFHNGQLRPALVRNAKGQSIASRLAKHFGARLSKASYNYPDAIPGHENVFKCSCYMSGEGGEWDRLCIEFTGLFHDKDGQKCRVERVDASSKRLIISCKT